MKLAHVLNKTDQVLKLYLKEVIKFYINLSKF